MLRDAYTTDVRAFALISGDSDFTAPLDLIRKDLNKQVLVFNPKDRPTDLRNHAAYFVFSFISTLLSSHSTPYCNPKINLR